MTGVRAPPRGRATVSFSHDDPVCSRRAPERPGHGTETAAGATPAAATGSPAAADVRVAGVGITPLGESPDRPARIEHVSMNSPAVCGSSAAVRSSRRAASYSAASAASVSTAGVRFPFWPNDAPVDFRPRSRPASISVIPVRSGRGVAYPDPTIRREIRTWAAGGVAAPVAAPVLLRAPATRARRWRRRRSSRRRSRRGRGRRRGRSPAGRRLRCGRRAGAGSWRPAPR